MAKLTQTVEATTEVVLAPRLKRQLVTELTAYAEIEKQLNALKEEKDALAAEIEKLREQADAKSVCVDDAYRITRVDGGTSKSLNKKKLFALGITPAQFDACHTERPRKAYTLITTPNSKSRAPKDEEE